MRYSGVVAFLLAYILISARRLRWLGIDRPAGALIGAVACVTFGALTPAQALAAIDGSTLALLFGVMGIGAFLGLDGFFDHAQERLARWAKTPARLLGLVVWSAGLLSALITNDALCLLATPVVVRLVEENKLPALPFVIALATAANTGSVITLVGNPQNMLCGILGGLTYRGHLLLVLPLGLICLAFNHLFLWWVFRRSLAEKALVVRTEAKPLPTSVWVTLAVLFATAIAFTSGASLPSVAIAAFAALMLIHRREAEQIWARIDWSVLLFFAALFVVVAGLVSSGAPALFFERFPLWDASALSSSNWPRLAAIFLFGSNVVSNVPFIVVVKPFMANLPSPELGWELLAVASTFAGNLTFLGSVANVIVAEQARSVGGMGFWQHLRVGLPLALITTAMATGWIWAYAHYFR